MSEPWSKNYKPSGWHDPLDPAFLRLMPLYNVGRPRTDLQAVERIAEQAVPERVGRHVVVVGTNGKTSTAHYLAALLEAAGITTGLYTSPHIRTWNERIRIGLRPVDSDELTETLQQVHQIAAAFQDNSGAVRFFDVLTLTAERMFVQAGVQVGVFEAGIGGRLDATKVLEPELTLLTSIGADHEELLGAEPAQRLHEKAGLVPGGGKLIASSLGRELDDDLERFTRARAVELEILEDPDAKDGEPAYRAANRALARAGAAAILETAAPDIDLSDAEGRFECGTVDGVPFIADVAHNPTAWDAFLDSVPNGTYHGVVSISIPRPSEELALTLARYAGLFDTVVTTNLTVRPARDPLQLAASISQLGVEAIAIDDPHTAFQDALDRCRKTGLPLLVFGSNYVVVDFLAWVAELTQTR